MRVWKLLNLPQHLQLSIMRILQDQFLVGVTGIVLNDRNEILLVKHTYRQTEWSLPGGYLKAQEHPMEGLEREVEEESGLKVRSDKQIEVHADPTSPRLDICVVGSYTGGDFKESDEVSNYGFFAYPHFPEISQNQRRLIERVLRHQDTIFIKSPEAAPLFYNLQGRLSNV